ncbi:hypothetical protein [Nocardia cyriacigeorgica]|uniref:hypothetical protein n=1 Tax=Nocardia cyriacigeorgica TaxID=135487 RepID=UPI0024550E0E|nr:hypothetical protein [Nocardia cyriacigeorgica]
MTTAERIEARGEARGRAEALIELMTAKFGPLPAAVVDRVRSAEPAVVRGWTTKVLTAASADEMFAG